MKIPSNDFQNVIQTKKLYLKPFVNPQTITYGAIFLKTFQIDI